MGTSATAGDTADDPVGPEVPRGYLRGCVLLLLAEQPAHGYEIAERLGALGRPDVGAASVYRLLRTMEHDDRVTSEWVPNPPHPPRRVYQLTLEGRAELALWAARLRRGQDFISGYLRRMAALAASATPPQAASDVARRGPPQT